MPITFRDDSALRTLNGNRDTSDKRDSQACAFALSSVHDGELVGKIDANKFPYGRMHDVLKYVLRITFSGYQQTNQRLSDTMQRPLGTLEGPSTKFQTPLSELRTYRDTLLPMPHMPHSGEEPNLKRLRASTVSQSDVAKTNWFPSHASPKNAFSRFYRMRGGLRI